MPSLSLTSKLAEKMAEVDSRGGFLNKTGARIGTLLALPTALIDVAGHVCTAALKIIPAIPGTIANGVAHLLHKHGKIEKKWSTECSIGGLLKNLAQAVKHVGMMILAPLVGVVSPKSMFKGFFPVQAKLAEVAKRENEFSLALQANRDTTKAAIALISSTLPQNRKSFLGKEAVSSSDLDDLKAMATKAARLSEKQFDNLLQGDYAEEPEVKAPRVQKNRFAEWDAAVVEVEAAAVEAAAVKATVAAVIAAAVKATAVEAAAAAEKSAAVEATAAAEKAAATAVIAAVIAAVAAEKAKVEAPAKELKVEEPKSLLHDFLGHFRLS